MTPNERKLIIAAKNGTTAFQREYLTQYPGTDGATISSQYSYYVQLDPNAANTSANTNTGGKQTRSNIFESVSKIATGYVKTQQEQEYMPQMREEYIQMDDVIDKIISKQGQLNDLSQIGKNIVEAAAGQMELYLKQQTALRTIVNESMGLTGQMAEDFREELTKANPELLRMGIGFNELAQSAQKLVESTGKFAFINSETWKAAGTAAKAFVGTLSEMVAMLPGFESIGLGARNAIDMVSKVGKQSLELGLQSQKTTGELNRNIGKLNEYGFKNGIEGLGKMVMKATEFRMSMESVFKIADKVMSPEGAIDLAANLQVLGGAIGDFNDPLKMMYMATNNVEGLQDALIGAAGGLATYNKEQGRFEVTGANLRRAKEMADQFGMSIGDLNKLAISTAERTSAAADLMARGLTLKEDQKEFITNIAQMKDGKMTIELNSERLQTAFGAQEIALENLTQAQVNQLLEYQDDFKKKTPEEIIRDQATAIMNMERDLNFIVALLRQQGGRAADDIYNKMIKKTGFDLNEKSKQFASFADANAPGIVQMRKDLVDGISGGFDKVEKAKQKANKGKNAPQANKVNPNPPSNNAVQVNNNTNTGTNNTNTGTNNTNTTNNAVQVNNNTQPRLFKIDVKVGDERIAVSNPGSYLLIE